jgi:hypothetical protein
MLTTIACQQRSPFLYQSDVHYHQPQRGKRAVVILKNSRNATEIPTKTIVTFASKKNAEAITGAAAE